MKNKLSSKIKSHLKEDKKDLSKLAKGVSKMQREDKEEKKSLKKPSR